MIIIKQVFSYLNNSPLEKEKIYTITNDITPQDSDQLWWDAFTTEFFEDDAVLTLSFTLEDGPKRYSLIISIIIIFEIYKNIH